jgi:hypothetical protein
MQHVATLSGDGWLRTRETGSAAATYRIEIYRHTGGPEHGRLVTHGVIAAEGWALAVARLEGAAVLVQQTGEAIDVRLTSMGSDTTAFFVVTGKMPTF